VVFEGSVSSVCFVVDLVGKAFDNDALLGSEIDERAQFHASGFEVVDDLRAMLVGES
jgi:hypothetical protein